MTKLSRFFVLASLFTLFSLSLLHGQASPKPRAQLQTDAPAPSNNETIPDTTVETPSESAVNPAPEGQAPDEMTRKITGLVHAGKYVEAQQLTNGLLIAYPNDQRLIKAKALIENLLASAGSTAPTPDNSQLDARSMRPAAAPLSGMDKVDYDALILLGRQAQQTTDLSEQTKLMGQFMGQSTAFLQKHPEQILLWQLRAAIAMVANLPVAGYEAGHRLLAAGVGDSSDRNSLRLLAELKNKGFMDMKIMERVEEDRREQAKLAGYEWMLGSWDASWSGNMHMAFAPHHGTYEEEFSKSGSSFEGYSIIKHFGKNPKPDLRVVILASGEVGWESANASGWQPLVSSQIDDDHRKMTIVSSHELEGKRYVLTVILTRK